MEATDSPLCRARSWIGESREVGGTQRSGLVVTERFSQPVVARARTHEIKCRQGESGQVGVHPSIMGLQRP